MTITVGSLFSGIGGIDLGFERAGMRVIWQSETDPYASKVLAKHWPTVPNLGDVTLIDWSSVERPDLVCGGFPCQPVSLAGRRLGQDDERWLWPAYRDAVRHLRPGHVFVENVPGLLVRGMGDVLGDLADLGYDCEWESFPAAAVGAAHRRYRILLVAHARRPRRRQDARGALGHEGPDAGWSPEDDHQPDGHGEGNRARTLAYANSSGLERRRVRRSATQRRTDVADPEGVAVGTGLCEGDEAGVWGRRSGDLSGPHRGWWATEPSMGRVAHGVPSRMDRLRCLGNAVVPQVAEFVGRRLALHIDGSRDG